MNLSRRNILAGAAAAVAISAAPARAAAPRFSLAYAPHEGSFKSRGGLLEQIAYAADQGFTAWEDNNAAARPVSEQEAMARALQSRGMTMGVFVASMPRWRERRPLLGGEDQADRDFFMAEIAASVEVAKRINARWATIVPGFLDPKIPHEIQTARVVTTLRRAADLLEPHGVIGVVEPLNTRTDHPHAFAQTTPQCYALAKAVRSPSLKVLADLYHEQVQAGNLLKTLETCWDEIVYIQTGDNPGRKEPGTGEINYKNIVRWFRARNYRGIVGMEHGNSADGPAGEARLIAAYREIDAA